ncbi:AEC family transporter [Yinghuangia sp. YIM S09857]|uniref:AEC family transporter n=1 Tax=Yinghuangia sp. YIM S09857 TaxID=3436929 RepID=UPI003F530158
MHDVVPLLALIAAGHAARRAGALTSDDGSALLRVVFHIALPPLVFLAVVHVEFDASLARLSLLGPTVCCGTLGVVLLLRRTALRTLDRRLFGAFLTGCAVMNTGFLLPFAERLGGPEALARLVVIDAFVTLTTFSLVHAVVVKVARDDAPDRPHMLGKLLASPPLWALAAAAVVRAARITPPAVLLDSFESAARATGALILIALGLKFEPKARRPGLLALTVCLRFGLGVLLAAVFAAAVGLDGPDARIALFAATAPVGFNTITFAELEDLEVEFAASQVSVGLITALALLPLTTRLVHP